ncbi:MAG: hypothetical protein WCA95_04245 [Opitutaceae bacterium]
MTPSNDVFYMDGVRVGSIVAFEQMPSKSIPSYLEPEPIEEVLLKIQKTVRLRLVLDANMPPIGLGAERHVYEFGSDEMRQRIYVESTELTTGGSSVIVILAP